MERNRSISAHAEPRERNRGVIADKSAATASSRSTRRHGASFRQDFFFGLKLVASAVIAAFVIMALWNAAAKSKLSPGEQPTDAAQEAAIVPSPPEGAETPAPSTFPKPVKTIIFTPSAK